MIHIHVENKEFVPRKLSVEAKTFTQNRIIAQARAYLPKPKQLPKNCVNLYCLEINESPQESCHNVLQVTKDK